MPNSIARSLVQDAFVQGGRRPHRRRDILIAENFAAGRLVRTQSIFKGESMPATRIPGRSGNGAVRGAGRRGADDAAADAALAGWSLQRLPGHLMRRCQQRAVDLFVAEVGENGPTPPQFALLLAVYQNPGVSQAALVRASGIDRSTLAELVRRMVDRGLLRRRRTLRDQRANALAVTAAGKALIRAVFPAMLRAQARILAPLPPDRHAAFLADLALVAGLGPDAEPPARISPRRTRFPGRAADRANN
jgi:DNA-binding MarR family transcriptional regulator